MHVHVCMLGVQCMYMCACWVYNACTCVHIWCTMHVHVCVLGVQCMYMCACWAYTTCVHVCLTESYTNIISIYHSHSNLQISECELTCSPIPNLKTGPGMLAVPDDLHSDPIVTTSHIPSSISANWNKYGNISIFMGMPNGKVKEVGCVCVCVCVFTCMFV